jgi:tryptophan synthase beta subunit
VRGQEALEQMELAGEYPDVVIEYVAGGSNVAGRAFPFVGQQLREDRNTRIRAVEPEACRLRAQQGADGMIEATRYAFTRSGRDASLAGSLQEYASPSEAIQAALTEPPRVARPA